MNRKITLDIAILISCLTGMILSYVYLDNYIEKEISLLIFGITGVLFLGLAVKDKNKTDKPGRYGTARKGISEILLLGEESNVTAVWDIYGKGRFKI